MALTTGDHPGDQGWTGHRHGSGSGMAGIDPPDRQAQLIPSVIAGAINRATTERGGSPFRPRGR